MIDWEKEEYQDKLRQIEEHMVHRDEAGAQSGMGESSKIAIEDLRPKAPEDLSRRIKRIVITPEVFGNLFTQGKVTHLKCVEGLPEGSLWTASTFDPTRAVVNIFFIHPSFPQIPAGAVVPEVYPLMEVIRFTDPLDADYQEK